MEIEGADFLRCCYCWRRVSGRHDGTREWLALAGRGGCFSPTCAGRGPGSKQPDEWERLLLAACEAKQWRRRCARRRCWTAFRAAAANQRGAEWGHAGRIRSLTGDLLDRTRRPSKGCSATPGWKLERFDPRAAGRWGDADAHGGHRSAGGRAGTKPDPGCCPPDEAVAHGAAIYAGLVCCCSGRQQLPRHVRGQRQLPRLGSDGHRPRPNASAAQGDDPSQHAAAGRGDAFVSARPKTIRRRCGPGGRGGHGQRCQFARDAGGQVRRDRSAPEPARRHAGQGHLSCTARTDV